VPETIEVTGGDYEHTLGLAGVRDGIDIRYTTAPLHDVFLRMVTERCYEACEFSLSNYLMLKDRGADWRCFPTAPFGIPRCMCAKTALCASRPTCVANAPASPIIR
jgi:hypothetical protein